MNTINNFPKNFNANSLVAKYVLVDLEDNEIYTMYIYKHCKKYFIEFSAKLYEIDGLNKLKEFLKSEYFIYQNNSNFILKRTWRFVEEMKIIDNPNWIPSAIY